MVEAALPAVTPANVCDEPGDPKRLVAAAHLRLRELNTAAALDLPRGPNGARPRPAAAPHLSRRAPFFQRRPAEALACPATPTPPRIHSMGGASGRASRSPARRCWCGAVMAWATPSSSSAMRPLLARSARSATVMAQPALVPLLSGLAGSASVRTVGAGPEPPADVEIDVTELPHAFRTTVSSIPSATPYLVVDPARVAAAGARLGWPDAPLPPPPASRARAAAP